MLVCPAQGPGIFSPALHNNNTNTRNHSTRIRGSFKVFELFCDFSSHYFPHLLDLMFWKTWCDLYKCDLKVFLVKTDFEAEESPYSSFIAFKVWQCEGRMQARVWAKAVWKLCQPVGWLWMVSQEEPPTFSILDLNHRKQVSCRNHLALTSVWKFHLWLNWCFILCCVLN